MQYGGARRDTGVHWDGDAHQGGDGRASAARAPRVHASALPALLALPTPPSPRLPLVKGKLHLLETGLNAQVETSSILGLRGLNLCVCE